MATRSQPKLLAQGKPRTLGGSPGELPRFSQSFRPLPLVLGGHPPDFGGLPYLLGGPAELLIELPLLISGIPLRRHLVAHG